MVPRRRLISSRASQTHGFMLLALLIGLILASITLMAAVDIWTVQRQREKEQDLLFAGDQYRQAIQRYYFAAPPGTPRVLPLKLADLLEDDRYPIPVRHLRRLYPDPVTGQPEWGEMRVDDRIAGVYSLSEKPPIKQAGFPLMYRSFAERTQYKEWVFAFLGGAKPSVKPAIPGINGSEETPDAPLRQKPGSKP
jgi:type II secretory pathway pseudopilin PulG